MTPRIAVAVYPGSFDPITNGHVDILRRSLAIFDRVIVAIAENVRKAPLFSWQERRDLLRAAVGSTDRVEYDAFSGLLVEYCRRKGARTIVRGLRALADFEYEFQFAHMNRRLAPGSHKFTKQKQLRVTAQRPRPLPTIETCHAGNRDINAHDVNF